MYTDMEEKGWEGEGEGGGGGQKHTVLVTPCGSLFLRIG